MMKMARTKAETSITYV